MNSFASALQQEKDDEYQRMFQQVYDDQVKSFNEMSQVHNLALQQQARRQIALNNDIAGMMKLAGANGRIPDDVRQYVNRRYGFDGQTTGILPSSGYDRNGAFVLALGDGVDPRTKQPLVSQQVYDPVKQYEMMNSNRAVFNDNDRSALRERLLRGGFSQNELDNIASQYDFSSRMKPKDVYTDEEAQSTPPDERAGTRDPNGAVRVPGSWLRDDRQRGGISAFSTDGKGGVSRTEYNQEKGGYVTEDSGTRDPKRQGQWKVIRNGPDGKVYENDMTGDTVTVKDGETPPWVKNAKSEKAQIEQMKQDNLNQRQAERLENQRMIQADKMAQGREKLDVDIAKWQEKMNLEREKSDTQDKKNHIDAKLKEMESLRKSATLFSKIVGDYNYPQELRDEASRNYVEILKKMTSFGVDFDDDGKNENVGDSNTGGEKTPVSTGDKVEIKSGDNEDMSTPPNGKYNIEVNGKKYRWGKTTKGEWKYFPDR